MKNKILLIISILLFILYLYQERSIKKDTSFFYTKIIEYDNPYESRMEDYIVYVVAAEMPASFELEALKAQAVAARTFSYYKIKNSDSSYVFYEDSVSQALTTQDELKNKWGESYDEYLNKIKEAVLSTKNEVITYNNQIICAYYHAMSNGKTENAKNVFNEELPYLVSVDSQEPTGNNFNFKVYLTKDEFIDKLGLSSNTITITNIVKDETNRVETIVINNKIMTGIEVRKKLNLRSTDFEIELEQDGISITTKGYGHGVGMSQYGSNELAKLGTNYLDILKKYYQNTEVADVNSILFS